MSVLCFVRRFASPPILLITYSWSSLSSTRLAIKAIRLPFGAQVASFSPVLPLVICTKPELSWLTRQIWLMRLSLSQSASPLWNRIWLFFCDSSRRDIEGKFNRSTAVIALMLSAPISWAFAIVCTNKTFNTIPSHIFITWFPIFILQ